MIELTSRPKYERVTPPAATIPCVLVSLSKSCRLRSSSYIEVVYLNNENAGRSISFSKSTQIGI